MSSLLAVPSLPPPYPYPTYAPVQVVNVAPKASMFTTTEHYYAQNPLYARYLVPAWVSVCVQVFGSAALVLYIYLVFLYGEPEQLVSSTFGWIFLSAFAVTSVGAILGVCGMKSKNATAITISALCSTIVTLLLLTLTCWGAIIFLTLILVPALCMLPLLYAQWRFAIGLLQHSRIGGPVFSIQMHPIGVQSAVMTV